MRPTRREIISLLAGSFAAAAKTGQAASYFAEPSDLENTIVAICETVLPGRFTDPDDIAGAVEAGAHMVLSDDRYEVASFLAAEAWKLNAASVLRYGRVFEKLPAHQREHLLCRAYKNDSRMREIVRTVKSAYYCAVMTDAAHRSLCYPAPRNRRKDV